LFVERTEIITEPEDNVVIAGSVATFHCVATADHSFNLNIDWLINGELIDYDTQTRFVKTNDYSLIITKTIELDSGIYTCLAKTELDQVTANATLIVQVKNHYLQISSL
jgi:neuronal cell adhesion molecule